MVLLGFKNALQPPNGLSYYKIYLWVKVEPNFGDMVIYMTQTVVEGDLPKCKADT